MYVLPLGFGNSVDCNHLERYMDIITLNLARKWRSQDFDHIIGQDLLIRMLKNSLYIGQYFPVYLFSGQRGCGKTTTARVFASALNCKRLAEFRKEPKNISIPCLTCDSCCAMREGKHPDFIEIDAASHTGVDNVRHIIESSSLLPLMGQKKIYLIDETHMLSKSAFNALLKILEEPPSSALFILATTNLDKIIDTVRSRCFQLFFAPVDQRPLLKHLNSICKQEGITCKTAALELIVSQTEGSVRDALNLLEQVRFSSSVVTKDAVLKVLGHIDDKQLINMLEAVLFKSPSVLLTLIDQVHLDQFAAEFIWNRFVRLIRIMLWLKHGVQPTQTCFYLKQLKALVARCSLKQLHDILDALYAHEGILGKTVAQHSLLEMVLLQLCQRNKKRDGGGSPSSALPQVALQEDDEEIIEEEYDEDGGGGEEDGEEDLESEDNEYIVLWASFLARLEQLNYPLVTSIFKQGVLKQINDNIAIDVEFAQDFIFFKDWLDDTTSVWLSILQELFGKTATINPLFTGEKKDCQSIKNTVKPKIELVERSTSFDQVVSTSTKSRTSFYQKRNGIKNKKIRPAENVVDVSDELIWKKANVILRYFPGTVTEIREHGH